MILSCNSCQKKFVVPDNAISASGRLVQCSSCGNKWKQFPNIAIEKKAVPKKIFSTEKKAKIVKTKKKSLKKRREIDLYSPEYLEKKHGISLNKPIIKKNININEKASFGFYNTLVVLLVAVIALSKGLHFFQDLIVQQIPSTKFYLDYFFESIRNIFEIWKNLIANY